MSVSRHSKRFCVCLAVASAALAPGLPAFAQSADEPIFGVNTAVAVEAQPDIQARFTVGLGASYKPDYFGADDYSFGPAGTFRFDFIRLPNGFEYGSSGAVGFLEGFGPRGSLRYIGARKKSDNPALSGLDNVDATLELGLGIGYEAQYWRTYADVRYGFIGHDDFVGEFGADAILRPRDELTVNFGPRAFWGGSTFMDTYFGVDNDESIAGFTGEYEPSAGFYSVGVELGARYAISDLWGVEGKANYERLIGDAGDSPITALGSDNQIGMQVILTRSISLGF